MPLADNMIDLSAFPKRTTRETMSPFRYPGGKGFLSGYFGDLLEQMKCQTNYYVEPFCGGAGAAWNLLADKKVEEIHLNDADIRIYSAWKAILNENDRFCEKLMNVSVDLPTWKSARELLSNYRGNRYSFELGFATYFINRTSRAGIVLGSGPIGGYAQSGDWKIDARFYRESMLKRIRWVGLQKDRVTLKRMEALPFLRSTAKALPPQQTLYFIDPPYVQAGGRLYLNAMTERKHRALAKYLISNALEHWVLTYDDDPLIREIYDGRVFSKLTVNYSLHRTRKENEVLVR